MLFPLISFQKIPNISKIREFMDLKSIFQDRAVSYIHAEIESYYSSVEEELKQKHESSQALLKTLTDKYGDQKKAVDNVMVDVNEVQDRLEGVRNPAPKPKDPYPDPIPEPIYVEDLPKSGGLNDKGKKKKDLKGADFNIIIKKIEKGDMDGQEWDFGTERWPGAKQTQQLQQARLARNQQLDKLKEEEQVRRDQAHEMHRQALVQWDMSDRLRQREYEQIKKESRKIFLKFDCAEDRANRAKIEMTNQSSEVNSWAKFIALQTLSKNRYRVNKAKQLLERERIAEVKDRLTKKLLMLLEARRKVLDLPRGADSIIRFEQLREIAERSLNTLRYEILECRQELINEGQMLRVLYVEELGCCQLESTRVRMLRDTVTQRTFIDKLLEKHKYESVNLLKDIEKLKLLEAEKDDLGLVGTIDDKGERYKLDRKWSNSNINEALRMLEMLSAKIALTEGVRETAANSQSNIMENMGVRWGTEESMTEDSLTHNIDVIRSKRLLNEVVNWVASQHDKILDRQQTLDKQEADMRSEIAALKKFLDRNSSCFNIETANMRDSTADVIAVVRDRMVRLDAEAQARIILLERNITDLSKECQQVREEKNQIAYDLGSRLDTLMSFILTLQTTLERMSSNVDIMQEERDEAVLTSRLEVDRMRHELRMERKHCSNLLFIIHGQRSFIQKLIDTRHDEETKFRAREQKIIDEKKKLRVQNWEQLFSFARMCTDVDDLFEFFATRIANLAGNRKSINDALRRNGAAVVLAAMCRSPRQLIRKCAARSLAGMGWDGFVETRVLMWDAVLQWKLYKERVLTGDLSFYDPAKEYFIKTGKFINLFFDLTRLN